MESLIDLVKIVKLLIETLIMEMYLFLTRVLYLFLTKLYKPVFLSKMLGTRYGPVGILSL